MLEKTVITDANSEGLMDCAQEGAARPEARRGATSDPNQPACQDRA